MNFVIYCLVIAYLVTYLDGKQDRFRCDYTYYKEADAYLKYMETPANWHEARLRCHMEGTTLASPLTPQLMKLMKNMTHNSQVNGIFTGIHSKFSRGDFYSVEGVPLSNIPHKWALNEPDNHEDKEGCIVMMADGAFADASCDETLPYICFKMFEKGMVMNDCGSTDNGYTMSEVTGNCYKFHTNPRTWSRAYMTCAAEGGYLAVINSEREAGEMRNLYAKNPDVEQVGDYVRGIAFIGIHDWDEHGEWRTIHGDTLVEAGYAKFAPGEPNNVTSEFCGGMYRNALLDDLWCYRRAYFICEKDPASLVCPEEEEQDK